MAVAVEDGDTRWLTGLEWTGVGANGCWHAGSDDVLGRETGVEALEVGNVAARNLATSGRSKTEQTSSPYNSTGRHFVLLGGGPLPQKQL